MQLERLWGGSGRTGGLTKGAVLQPQGKAATLSPHTHALEAALRAPWEVLPVGCTLTWQERALSHARTWHRPLCLLKAKPLPGPFLKGLRLSQVTASSTACSVGCLGSPVPPRLVRAPCLQQLPAGAPCLSTPAEGWVPPSAPTCPQLAPGARGPC